MRFYERNGTLYVDFILDGKRKRKSTKLSYNEDNIKAYKRALLSNDDDISLNLNDMVNDIIDEKRLTLKETSIICYESVFKNLIAPYFENKLITHVKAKDIKRWQLELVSKDIKTPSIAFARTLLIQTFDNAIIEDIIENNPLRAVKLISNKSDYEINPFTLEEIELILYHAKGYFKNLLGLAFFSGMRIGEIIGLKWSDIDLINRTISINRTINKGRIQSPKTKSSKRVIDIIDTCYPYIADQQRFTKLKNEFVFINRQNRPYSSSYNLRYRFKKILDSANIEYRAIYQTRHSFASMMLNHNESLMWVSSMLGHKSSDITLKKYSKYIKRDDIKRAEFLENWHMSGTN